MKKLSNDVNHVINHVTFINNYHNDKLVHKFIK